MGARLVRLFRTLFHALLGDAEARMPAAVLEEATREMLDSLRGLREATAGLVAFEMATRRELEAQTARVRNLELHAEQALARGNEKLARRALQLQAQAQAAAARARSTLDVATARAGDARNRLLAEEERVRAKIQKLGELKAMAAMNEAQRRMQTISDEHSLDGALRVFDDTASAIREEADRLAALDALAVSEGEDLDRQLAAMSEKAEVDSALAALKKRLGPTS